MIEDASSYYAHMFFKISNGSLSAHFQTLAIRWWYVITTAPLMNLFLSVSIRCFLLVKTLQFPIPKDKNKLYVECREADTGDHEAKELTRKRRNKLLHSFIQLPSCDNQNALLFGFFAENSTPRLRLLTLVMHNDRHLQVGYQKTKVFFRDIDAINQFKPEILQQLNLLQQVQSRRPILRVFSNV